MSTAWDELGNHETFMRRFGEGVGIPTRDFFLECVRDGESMLDVGCGPGVTYENLAKHDRRVRYRGLDYCQAFIDVCREMFPEGDFRRGDARALPEADRSWDVVLLRHVVAHTGGYRSPICEAVRVARRRVVIVMWRPLMDGKPDRIKADGNASDYDRKPFLEFLDSLPTRIERRELPARGRKNWVWVLRLRGGR